MLDAIKYGYADMLNALLRLPDWLTTSVLVIAGILLALVISTAIMHTLRNTISVHHRATWFGRIPFICVGVMSANVT